MKQGKRVLSFLLALSLVIGLLPAVTLPASAADLTALYVSADGDDANDGTSESAPLKTLTAAFDKIKAATDTADVTVYVMTDLETGALSLTGSKNVTLTSHGNPAVPWVIQKTGAGNLLTWNSSASLTVKHLTLDGNGLSGYLGNIAQGTLALGEGATLRNNGASAVLVGEGASLVMEEGALITGNTSSGYVAAGGVIVYIGAFTMNGGAISGNTSSGSGGVLVMGGTFTMNGGAISGNTSSGSGGGVFVEQEMYGTPGKFTMTGGAITGNTSERGGGVSVAAGGTFNLSGGAITGNTGSTNGGGVYLEGGAFNLSGGAITGNTGSTNGGGVYLENGAFNLSGGAITGNTGSTNGGGVYLENGAFNLSGAPTVTGNTVAGSADNVCLAANKTITLGSLSAGANIGVNTVTRPTSTASVSFASGTGLTDTQKGYFTSDDDTAVVLRPDTTTLRLLGLGNLYGTAQTTAGRGASGVTVTALQGDTPVANTNTNEQGSWYMTLADGTYTVKAATSADRSGRPQRITAIKGDSSASALTNGVSLTISTGSTLRCDITVEQAVKLTFDGGDYGTASYADSYGWAGDALTGDLPTVYKVAAGKEFVGWNTDKTADAADPPTSYPSADTTYYAIYSDKEYTVRYLDTGDTAVPAATVHYGDSGLLPAVSRQGYTLKEWRVAGTDTVVTADTKYGDIAPTADSVTLRAVWELRNDITVTLNANGTGATVDSAPTKSYANQTYGALIEIAPRRSGYTFLGWSLQRTPEAAVGEYAPHGYVQVPDPRYVDVALGNTDSAVTYYAIWEAGNEVDVTLDRNYTGAPEAETLTGIAGETIRYTMPTREGYAFKGWITEEQKAAGATEGDFFPVYPAANATLYATWEAGSVTVVYHPMGGDFAAGESGVRTDKTGEDLTPPNNPTRTGYTFGGWNTKPDGTGAAAPALTKYPTANVSYYAKWTANEVTVRLNHNYGGTPTETSVTGRVDEAIRYTMPIRNGYAFKGWITEEQKTAGVTAGDFFPVYPTADATLYATWEAGSVTLRYDPMGGKFTGNGPDGLPETGIRTDVTDAVLTPPAAPVRPGYTFVEWNTMPDGTGDAVTATVYPAASATYYAKWRAEELTVTVTETVTYDGTAKKPAVTVKAAGSDAALTEGRDYVLVYENNINATTDSSLAKVTAYGLNDYAGLKGEANFSIEKAEQTVTFAKGTTGLTTVYGQSYVNVASALGGADITYSINTDGLTAGTASIDPGTGALTLSGVGAVTVTASAAESANYKAGSGSYTLTVNKADPVLTFANSSIGCATDRGSVSNPLTTDPTGLTITYSVTEGADIASVGNDGTVTLTGKEGRATVKASFAGNDFYNPASASYTITVSDSTIGYTVSGVRTKYDGSAHSIQVEVSVPATGAEITYCETKDGAYNAANPSYTEAGTYPVYYKITAEGYSEVSGMALVVIEPLELTEAVVSDGTYTGSPVETTVTSLTVNTKNGLEEKTDLTVNTDYTVAFYNNVAAGTAKAVITGTGNYTGTLVKDYTISPKALTDSSITVANISDQTYTGSTMTPSVTVTDGGVTLVEGRDYTVAYRDDQGRSVDEMKDVGAYTVVVTGMGNYSGAVEKPFTITNRGAFTVVVVDSGLTYTGSAQKPTVLVYVGDKLLAEGTDYTLSDNEETAAGSYTLTVTGKDNYAESGENYKPVSKPWSIAKADKTVTVGDVTKTYGDDPFTQTVTLDPADSAALTYVTGDPSVVTVDTDGLITILSAGTATITVRTKETTNYKAAEGSFTVTVKPKVTTFAVDAIDVQTYTGSAIQPAVVVKDGNTVLTENVDYTLSYADNTAIGTATVTVTGKGNYDGSSGEQTFEIIANSNDFEVELSNETHTYDGTAQTLTDVTVKYGGVELTKDTHYTLTYSNNTNAGTAVVTVNGAVDTAYEGLSSVRTFAIGRRPLTDAMVTAIPNQTYTGTSIRPEVTVTDTIGGATATPLVKDRDYSVTYGENLNVGTGTVTLTGQGNYQGTVTVNFNIAAKTTGLAIQSIPDQAYTGSAITPSVIIKDGDRTLTQGVDYEVGYTNNINVGEATVNVTYQGNYGGTDTTTFQIKASAQALIVTVDPLRDVWSADRQPPAIRVKLNNTDLTEGDNGYRLTYQTYNENGALVPAAAIDGAGVYIITASSTGSYAGASGSAVFVRLPAATANGLHVTGPGETEITYDGADHSDLLNVTVTLDDGTPLGEGDYTRKVSYNNGAPAAVDEATEIKDVGVYVLELAGVGNYEGNTASVAIVISPKDVNDDSITVEGLDSVTYNGQERTPTIAVKDGENTTLELNRDYTVTMEASYKAAGSYDIVIRGTGNYTGTRTEVYTIQKAMVRVTGSKDMVYGGALPDTADLTVSGIVEGDDVTVDIDAPEYLSVGEHDYTATLSGAAAGNYEVECTATLTVTAKALDETFTAALSSVKGYYTGDPHTPVVTVRDGDATLVRDRDYTVSYLDKDGESVDEMIGVGDYTVVITGTGNYTGGLELEYTVANAPSGGGIRITYPPIVKETEHGSVTVTPEEPARGDTVLIRPAPDKGYRVERVTVTLADGSAVEVTDNGGLWTYEQPGERVTVEVLFQSATGGSSYADCAHGGECPVWPFTDASPAAWYHDGVHYCVETGLMIGTGAETFTPGGATTRAQIATILWRLEGEPVVDYAMSFTDVAGDAWYTEAVRWAQANGIVTGYTDTVFGPEDPITREQMAAILYRYCRYRGVDVSAGGDLEAYVDGENVSAYAVAAMEWACGAGVIQGIPGSLLDPRGSAIRAQVAMILMRYCVEVIQR